MGCFGIQVSGLAQDVELLAFGPLYQQTAAFSAGRLSTDPLGIKWVHLIKNVNLSGLLISSEIKAG